MILLLYVVAIILPLNAATTTQANSKSVIGIWDVVDSEGKTIDSINIDLAVSGKKSARFTFEQASLGNDVRVDPLQGYLFSNIMAFDLIEFGKSKTYVFKIDFDLGGGPGYEVTEQIADCSQSLDDINQVRKAYRNQADSDLYICDASKFYDSSTREVKLVRREQNANQIPEAVALQTNSVIKNLRKNRSRIQGSWQQIKSTLGNYKIAIQNFESIPFGYVFDYKLIKKSQKLGNLQPSSFASGVRQGFFVGGLLIYNSTVFGEKNRLDIINIGQKTRGNGRELLTINGKCYPMVNTFASQKQACNANQDDLSISNKTRVRSKLKVKKIKTKFSVNF